MSKLRSVRSISLTVEENAELDSLVSDGKISVVDIFRRGMAEIKKENLNKEKA